MACLKTFLSFPHQLNSVFAFTAQKVLTTRTSFISVAVVSRLFSQFEYAYQDLNNRTQGQLRPLLTTSVTSQTYLYKHQHSSSDLNYCKQSSSIPSYQRNYSTMRDQGLLRDDTIEIFQSAVSSVLPRQMINKNLKYDSKNNILEVQNNNIELNHNVYIVGFGKAVLGMARAVEDILHDHLVEGIVSVPVGTQQCFTEAGKWDLLLAEGSKVTVYEGANNNLPDSASHKAAQCIHQLVTKLKQDSLLIVLISGGGSALLPLPHHPITLEEEIEFTRMLSRGGATIQELNTIRKHIEVLKGGGMAQLAKPAKVLSLILPDAIGDDLDIIASGPTVNDPSTTAQCLSLIERFDLSEKTPESILTFLNSKSAMTTNSALHKSFTSGSSDKGSIEHVLNVVVGSNTIAVNAASEKAHDMGYLPIILTSAQEGNAADVGVLFATLARFVCLLARSKKGDKSSRLLSETELTLVGLGIRKDLLNSISKAVHAAGILEKGLCLIAGGETTVKVKGTGRGGRNQEMALACAIALKQQILECDIISAFHIHFLSGGTDGIDGPTDAAGAIVSPEFSDNAQKEGFDAAAFLENNDSYSIFSKVNEGLNLIKTGHTGTNVMDLQILVIKPN